MTSLHAKAAALPGGHITRNQTAAFGAAELMYHFEWQAVVVHSSAGDGLEGSRQRKRVCRHGYAAKVKVLPALAMSQVSPKRPVLTGSGLWFASDA